MSSLNAYANLVDFKAYWQSRGGTTASDTSDDAVIEVLLISASQFIEDETSRHYTPYIETRYYDVPCDRTLELDDDLLEVITLANGDGTSITSTQYDLGPRNQSPYREIRLKDNVAVQWLTTTTGNFHNVIAVTALWGYHPRYLQAWRNATTLSADVTDTTSTTFTVTSAATFAVGNLIRLDNELSYLSAVSTTLTGTRGENYSTAATHSSGINVYVWQPYNRAKTACLELAHSMYQKRFGQSSDTTTTITAGGIVVSPRDVPSNVWQFIKSHRDMT